MKDKLISFDELFYCGLFGFVRKVELSIHRAQSIEELKNYLALYEDEFNNVMYLLSNKISKEHTIIKQIKEPSFLRKIIGKYIYVNKLFESEILYLLGVLSRLREVLSNDSTKPKDSNYRLRQIRLNLRYLYEDVLGVRIDRMKKEMLLNVEHLNQNSYLDTRPIKDMIGEWY